MPEIRTLTPSLSNSCVIVFLRNLPLHSEQGAVINFFIRFIPAL